MATLMRNEEDVLEHNLRYHRAQGVDHFIVTDNGSTDRTPEILGRYEAAGLLTLIQEPATDDFRSQAAIVADAHGASGRDRVWGGLGGARGRRRVLVAGDGNAEAGAGVDSGQLRRGCRRRGRSSSPAPTARERSGSG